MSDEAVYLLGYYARVQTMIELLVQLRLRPLQDVREGLGSAYFEQMSDATRKRWLKALTADAVNSPLGSRLESVYAQVANVRNHIAHAPMNIGNSGDVNPGDIRVGSSRWMDKPLPSAAEIAATQAQLEWIESWVVWLLTRQQVVTTYQKSQGALGAVQT